MQSANRIRYGPANRFHESACEVVLDVLIGVVEHHVEDLAVAVGGFRRNAVRPDTRRDVHGCHFQEPQQLEWEGDRKNVC